MALHLITAATRPVIPLDEMKRYLRKDDNDEDLLVEGMVEAVTGLLEGRDGFLGRALMEQVWEERLPAFPRCDRIRIPLPPLVSIDSIVYLDAAGAEQTLSPAVYEIDGEAGLFPAHVVLADGESWPDTADMVEAVKIRFTAGYARGQLVPAGIREAIKMMAAGLYHSRGDSCATAAATDMTKGAQGALLSPYVVPFFA